MNRMAVATAALLLTAFLSGAWAAAGDGMEQPPSREQMEKVRERVETLRMWRLTKALDLDEKTSSRLFPVLNRFDRKRHELEQSLRDGMRDLREAVREGRDSALKGILDRLEQNHREMQRLNEEERAELKRLLSVRQQAAFVIFQQEFQQDIRRMIEETRGRRPRGPMDRERPEMRDRPLPPERP